MENIDIKYLLKMVIVLGAYVNLEVLGYCMITLIA